MNEEFETIARAVKFPEIGWSTDELPLPQIPCPTCAGSSYTHHADDLPMRSIIGHRTESDETVYLLDCQHIAID